MPPCFALLFCRRGFALSACASPSCFALAANGLRLRFAVSLRSSPSWLCSCCLGNTLVLCHCFKWLALALCHQLAIFAVAALPLLCVRCPCAYPSQQMARASTSPSARVLRPPGFPLAALPPLLVFCRRGQWLSLALCRELGIHRRGLFYDTTFDLAAPALPSLCAWPLP